MFELRESIRIGSAIYLSDGVMNLALPNFVGDEGNAGRGIGANHFDFQVDDLAARQRHIDAAGGSFFFDLGDAQAGNFGRKFRDPDGVVSAHLQGG